MQCDGCGQEEASVHLTEIINGEVTKLHLCEECAKEKSEEMQSHFGLTDLLSGLMDFGAAVPGGDINTGAKIKCPVCGMTYYGFQKTGRLGCGKCYSTFQKNLRELLKKIHGSEKHIGKMPLRSKEAIIEGEDLQRLKDELNELIREEKFEKAAVLLDRIKDLEKKI